MGKGVWGVAFTTPIKVFKVFCVQNQPSFILKKNTLPERSFFSAHNPAVRLSSSILHSVSTPLSQLRILRLRESFVCF